MSTDDVFEASADGRFRVRIVLDQCAMEPDWDEPGEAEMQAWREGEVYGWVVEERVTWTTPRRTQLKITGNIGALVTGPDTMTTWEQVDSCWGFYGLDDYLKSEAREALGHAAVSA